MPVGKAFHEKHRMMRINHIQEVMLLTMILRIKAVASAIVEASMRLLSMLRRVVIRWKDWENECVGDKSMQARRECMKSAY